MGYITGNEWYKDPKKAMNYYCHRLSFLEEYAKKIGEGYFFIESNDLVDKTDYVLDSLSKWLNLIEPLDKNYTNFRNTAKPSTGDPSHNIKSGIIRKTKGHPDINVPRDILQKGESAYIKCKDILLRGIT